MAPPVPPGTTSSGSKMLMHQDYSLDFQKIKDNVALTGHNLCLLVEIGLTDWPKFLGAFALPSSRFRRPCRVKKILLINIHFPSDSGSFQKCLRNTVNIDGPIMSREPEPQYAFSTKN